MSFFGYPRGADYPGSRTTMIEISSKFRLYCSCGVMSQDGSSPHFRNRLSNPLGFKLSVQTTSPFSPGRCGKIPDSPISGEIKKCRSSNIAARLAGCRRTTCRSTAKRLFPIARPVVAKAMRSSSRQPVFNSRETAGMPQTSRAEPARPRPRLRPPAPRLARGIAPATEP